LLTLPPYGFYWFLLAPLSSMPTWFVSAPEPLPEFVTLVVRSSLEELLAEPLRSVLEKEVLPVYLPKRRWFAGKDQILQHTRIAEIATVPGIEPPVLLAEIEAQSPHATDRYLLPFGFISEEALAAALPQQLALARVRRGRRVGFLTDAFALDNFARRLMELLSAGARVAAGNGELQFNPSARLAAVNLGPEPAVRRSSAEQSNSALIIGGQVMIKLFRRIHAGAHPEAEMGRYLTERGFANIAPLLGEISRVGSDGVPYTLGVAQSFIYNAESLGAHGAGGAGDARGGAAPGTERCHRALSEGRQHARSAPRRDARGAGTTERSAGIRAACQRPRGLRPLGGRGARAARAGVRTAGCAHRIHRRAAPQRRGAAGGARACADSPRHSGTGGTRLAGDAHPR
jgi:hypothetical protein